MITCTKLKATIPETTCIARQAKIEKLGEKLNGLDYKNWGYQGGNWLKFDSCVECKTGLELYNKSLKGKTMEEKTCTKCGKKKRIDLFYRQSARKDGRMAQCKKCYNLWRNAEKKAEPEIPKFKKPIQILPKIKKAVCTTCGEKKELTKEFFHARQRSETGFSSACKICRNKKKRIIRGTQKGGYVIDLSQHPDVVEKVEGWARAHLRTPENQIIWHLMHTDLV